MTLDRGRTPDSARIETRLRPRLTGMLFLFTVILIALVNGLYFGWLAGMLYLIGVKGAFMLGYFWPSDAASEPRSDRA